MTNKIADSATTPIAAALVGVVDAAGEREPEQQRMLEALAGQFLRIAPVELSALEPLPPDTLAAELPDLGFRRRFVQMAVIVELCRHPKSEAQRRLVDAYGAALRVGGTELEAVRAEAEMSTTAATVDFVRRFDEYRDELSEMQFVDPERSAERPIRTDEELWEQVHSLGDLPAGTLGREYAEFHWRNGFDLPGLGTPSPAYYVSHDMNHVIAGYEPTGPGEIGLGAFKLAMNDSDANWMASMVNLMIHEVGLIKHGGDAQFEPFGGAPYPGPDGQFGALSLPGAPELVAEAFARGAACTADFSRADHLALAALPLAEVRKRFHVIPLAAPMRPDEDPGLWPARA